MLSLERLFVFMHKATKKNLEPERKESTCVYCGDAPINHSLFYFTSFIVMTFDNHIVKVTKHAPDFLKNSVDWILLAAFEGLIFFHLAELSDDIDKAKTFRSKVIWEEAKRRGIEMKQFMMFGSGLDQYRSVLGG